MTTTRSERPTVSQSDKVSSNGKGCLKGDNAGMCAELEVAQTIPVLSDNVVNVASVPQRSPLRYPGGKTWLVPEIRKFLKGLGFRPEVFVEPFAGGGIASLTAIMDGFVDRAVLCEKDPNVSNLWRCMLDDAEELARRVERFAATPENVRAVIADVGVSGMDAAFRTLLWNRISRGGIMAKGASVMKQGENGKGISSRWYADTLAARIRTIGSHAERLAFSREMESVWWSCARTVRRSRFSSTLPIQLRASGQGGACIRTTRLTMKFYLSACPKYEAFS